MNNKLGKIIADFSTQLTTKISIGGTTGVLLKNTDSDGEVLPCGKYFFTIDGDNANKEYIACFLDGNNIINIFSISRQGVESVGVKKEHRVGASVTITDHAILHRLAGFFTGSISLDSETPLTYDSQPQNITDKTLVTKKYVDTVAYSGAEKASGSVIGLTRLSTNPINGSEPIALGENDNRTSPVSLTSLTSGKIEALAGSVNPPSSSTPYLTNYTVTTNTPKTGGYLVGESGATNNINIWKAVDSGAFGISINGINHTFNNLNFTSVSSMTDVVNIIKNVLNNASAGASIMYNVASNNFTIYSGTVGNNSLVSRTYTVSGGVDISGAGTPFLKCNNGTEIAGADNVNKIPVLNSDGFIDDSFISYGARGCVSLEAGDNFSSITYPRAVTFREVYGSSEILSQQLIDTTLLNITNYPPTFYPVTFNTKCFVSSMKVKIKTNSGYSGAAIDFGIYQENVDQMYIGAKYISVSNNVIQEYTITFDKSFLVYPNRTYYIGLKGSNISLAGNNNVLYYEIYGKRLSKVVVDYANNDVKFNGFINSNATIGSNIIVNTGGVMCGFSDLLYGEEYCIETNGNIKINDGNLPIIGRAINSNTLLVNNQQQLVYENSITGQSINYTDPNGYYDIYNFAGVKKMIKALLIETINSMSGGTERRRTYSKRTMLMPVIKLRNREGSGDYYYTDKVIGYYV